MLSDKYGNIFSLKRTTDYEKMEEIFNYGFSFGLGESISKLLSFVKMQEKFILCVSVLGSIYVLIPLKDDQFSLLKEFQDNLKEYLTQKQNPSSTLHFPLSSLHQESILPSQNVLDGIFLTRFLQFCSQEKEEILQIFIEKHQTNQNASLISETIQELIFRINSFQ